VELNAMARASRYVLGRENNIVRVDFTREPDPPAPRFPGAGALRAAQDLAAAVTSSLGSEDRTLLSQAA
jgi:hypothetical protein